MLKHPVTVIPVILFSSSAMSASFYLNEKYSTGIGRANSGEAAVADGPTVLAHNPAAITRFDGLLISTNLTLTSQQLDIESVEIN
ncbi:hypothetical protein A8L45_02055 [Veronia pacifica]|uniref:Long-chain fatty acid transport protein n=1 Tax=Veronia pacifica TaxID=1080227 RepID=A0A1C3ERG4_9GAMM|nr:hypothetical protein A8L45_02055 [Veronia pacifica]